MLLERDICKDVSYDDKDTDDLIRNMDGIFGRNFEEMTVDEFPRAEKEQCEKCEFRVMCLI